MLSLACAASMAMVAVIDDPGIDQPQEQQGDEIVVTGERIPRTLRETASSLSLVSERDIEAQSADRVDQLLALIPNVQLGNGSEGPAIRGQDTTGALQALPAFLGGNRPRTTLIVDGRRMTYNEFVFGAQPAWDLDRVEVFRSPQTTTQGQNSIAGAIFVYSNDPTSKPEHRARAIGGNYRTGQFSALASGPITDEVAFRVAGDIRYSHTTSHIADRIEDGDPNHDVFGLARVKLLAIPSWNPGARFELVYSHTHSQAPQIVGLTQPFRERRDENGFYGVFKINVDSLTATAHQPLAPDLALEVVITGGDSDTRRLAFPGLGQTQIDGRDWSAEAILNWSPVGSLQGVAGVSRTHQQLRQSIDLSLLSGIGRFDDKQGSFGLFGETSIVVLPRMTLTVGLRYQQDRQDRTGAFVAEEESVPLDFDRTFHAWLPKLSLAYDLSSDVRVGALAQRAYNPGGTTLRLDTGEPDNFEAEFLWDYEAFVRARLAGSRADLSANLFYYDMEDAQRANGIFVNAPGGFPVGFSDLFNAQKAYSYGAEVGLAWRPTDRIETRVSIGLLRTKLVDTGSGYEEFAGNEFGRSPRFSVAAAVDWEATPNLRLSAQARYHGDYYSDDSGNPDVRISPATIVDARAEYHLRRFTLFAYARNLFDNFALISGDPNGATAEDPRMVGVGIESRF
ncbi:TonB-dependent receptor [Sphingomonas sp. NSE70-1]|uniref:TonB-dependent receptor n=1 Tax=Sphingomonas caseinilyticus TaxID=2908205 RepID=A0ABT0RTD9_9SPHN|nr:TonB-dependent receptor [Sphingomonas caseinilyticus]MCL6698270.1 TonB-dependent receptor [Sphingomonas caseinilyticus]